jgi:CHU_C Type IX secretion signal domain/PKD-like domain/PKD domain
MYNRWWSAAMLTFALSCPLWLHAQNRLTLTIQWLDSVGCVRPVVPQSGINNADDSNCDAVCPFSTSTYTLRTPAGSTRLTDVRWQVQGAQSFTANGNQLTVVWGGPGNSSITATAAFGDNRLGAERCVVVAPLPRAAFTLEPAPNAGQDTLTVCTGQTVWMNSERVPGATVEWLIGDSTRTTAQRTEYTFGRAGLYPIRLTVQTTCACTDNATRWVRVLHSRGPALDCVAPVCAGASSTYTLSPACTDARWTISSNGTTTTGGMAGSPSATVRWQTGPEGTIAVACASAGCALPVVYRVPVLSDKAVIEGPTRICGNGTAVYTIQAYPGAYYRWSISGGGRIKSGDGTPSIEVDWNLAPGATQEVRVSYEHCYLGCRGQALLSVRALPVFTLQGPARICPGGSGTFQAVMAGTNTPLTTNWRLTGPDGAIAWTSASPAASASVTFPQTGGAYQISATPTNADQTCLPAAFLTVQVPVRTLTLGRIVGDTLTCTGQTATYAPLGGGPNLQWRIQNGPNTPISVVGNPVNVAWSVVGPYQLTARQPLTDDAGCGTDSVTLTVKTLRQLDMSGKVTVCAGTVAQYSATTLQSARYNWQIQPATAGTIVRGQGTATISIFWREPGGHVVSASACGQTASFPTTVWSNPEPVVNAPTSLCPGDSVEVRTTMPFDFYSWRTAEGTLLSTNDHAMVGPGYYTLNVRNGLGCSGNIQMAIQSKPRPSASVSTTDPNALCNNAGSVTLRTTVPTGSNYQYTWQRDLQTVATSGTAYTTNQYGTYQVLVSNAEGCTTVAGPVRVVNDCSANGGGGGVGGGNIPTALCPPGVARLAIDPTAWCDTFRFRVVPEVNYVSGSTQWFFETAGSGIFSPLTDSETTQRAFQMPGAYRAVMSVLRSDNNQRCIVTDTFIIKARAGFTSQPACAGDTVTLKNQSIMWPGTTVTNWRWTLAPGINAATTDAQYIYTSAGRYPVTLTLTTNTGCQSSVQDSVFVPALPVLRPVVSLRTCFGNAVAFVTNPATPVSKLLWNFSDAGAGLGNMVLGDTVYHRFSAIGNYMPALEATTVYNCRIRTTFPLSVEANTLSGTITPANPAPFCTAQGQVLTAPAGLSYRWSNGATTASITTRQTGLYKVTVSDAAGCTVVPDPVPIETKPGPSGRIRAAVVNQAGYTTGFKDSLLVVCSGTSVNLQLQSSSGNYQYRWSNGSTTDVYSFVVTADQTFTVSITDPAAGGCTFVTAPFVVRVVPAPPVPMVALTGSACAGTDNVLRTNTVFPATNRLVWNTGATGPTLTARAAGTYYLTAIDAVGCSSISQVVNIRPGPDATAVPGGCYTRCGPDTLCIQPGLSATRWQWLLNDTPIAGATSPRLIARQTGVYQAILTDATGCTAQSTPLNLDLSAGTGTLEGRVWADVNNNQRLDAADTIVSGIAVRIGTTQTARSGADGRFSVPGLSAGRYNVCVDTTQLPVLWKVVVACAPPADVSGCNGRTPVDLLLRVPCSPTINRLNLTVCPGDSVKYQGISIKTGQTRNFTLKNRAGCDSIVTVQVAALPPSTGRVQASVCAGQDFMYNGAAIPAGQTRNFTLKNRAGCDSIVTVQVTALPVSIGRVQASVCAGQDFMYNGAAIPAGQTRNFTLKNRAGCDSIVTVQVTALPPSISRVQASVCAGQDFMYNGAAIPAGQTRNFTLKNRAGCDSIVTVQVTALPPSISRVQASVCAGQDFMYNGAAIPAGQTRNFTLKNRAGCDSIVTVQVTALPVSNSRVQASACAGQDFMYNGNAIPAGQTRNFTLKNRAGCDSIVTVQVTALPPSTGRVQASVCAGQDFMYNGAAIPAGQTRNFTLKNRAGCDSIVTVQVTALPPSTGRVQASVCAGQDFMYNGAAIPAGQTRNFTLKNRAGCDSIVTVDVTAWPTVRFELTAVKTCLTQPDGSMEATGLNGTPPYRFALDQGAFGDSARFSRLGVGRYTLTVRDRNGCTATQSAFITPIARLDGFLPNVVLPCDGFPVQNQPLLGPADPTEPLRYQWADGQTTPSIAVRTAGPIRVRISNRCEAISLSSQANWSDERQAPVFYAPNVFMPNVETSTAANGQFVLQVRPDARVQQWIFRIFDRWGNQVFFANDLEEAWNGMYRDRPAPSGVYLWTLQAVVEFCGRTQVLNEAGDVVVVR